MRTKLLLIAGLAVLSSGAFAQSLSLAGTVGIFLPSNSQIKNLVGSQFLTYGVTPWAGTGTANGLSPEIDFIGGSGNGNSFYLVPVTLAYEKDFTSSAMSKTSTSIVPYLRVSAGITYFSYNITDGSGNFSSQRFGETAGLEGGLKLSNSAKLYVKYDIFSVEQGFNFSGTQVGIVFSLFKL